MVEAIFTTRRFVGTVCPRPAAGPGAGLSIRKEKSGRRKPGQCAGPARTGRFIFIAVAMGGEVAMRRSASARDRSCRSLLTGLLGCIPGWRGPERQGQHQSAADAVEGQDQPLPS